jgi:hypothetical protein
LCGILIWEYEEQLHSISTRHSNHRPVTEYVRGIDTVNDSEIEADLIQAVKASVWPFDLNRNAAVLATRHGTLAR